MNQQKNAISLARVICVSRTTCIALCLLIVTYSCASFKENDELRIKSYQNWLLTCPNNEIPINSIMNFEDTLISALAGLSGSIFIDSCSISSLGSINMDKFNRLIQINPKITIRSKSNVYGVKEANGIFLSFGTGLKLEHESTESSTENICFSYTMIFDGRPFGAWIWYYYLIKNDEFTYRVKQRVSGGIID